MISGKAWIRHTCDFVHTHRPHNNNSSVDRMHSMGSVSSSHTELGSVCCWLARLDGSTDERPAAGRRPPATAHFALASKRRRLPGHIPSTVGLWSLFYACVDEAMPAANRQSPCLGRLRIVVMCGGFQIAPSAHAPATACPDPSLARIPRPSLVDTYDTPPSHATGPHPNWRARACVGAIATV